MKLHSIQINFTINYKTCACLIFLQVYVKSFKFCFINFNINKVIIISLLYIIIDSKKISEKCLRVITWYKIHNVSFVSSSPLV